MAKRIHTSFSSKYIKIGQKMLGAAFRLRAGVQFDYLQYPGLLEEITRSLSGKVLHLGAAGGWLVEYLRKRKRETFGIDNDVEHLKGDNLVAGSAEALPFKDKVFDGVYSGFCYTYIEEKMSALKEMARVTVPLGDLVMLIHHPDSDIREEHKKFLKYYEENTSKLASNPLYVNQYVLSSAFMAGCVEDEDDLRAMIVKAGYRIKTLRQRTSPDKIMFSSFVMKDVPLNMVFWLLRATRDLE